MSRIWISSPYPMESPWPKWMYHATEDAKLVNNEQEQAALGPEWSDKYVTRDYPKCMYKDGGATTAADPAAEAALVADGWSTSPPVIPDVPPVDLEPASATCPVDGGTGTFTVTVTGPGQSGTWTADKQSSATWLTVSPTTPQPASGTVTWTAATNDAMARSGEVYVNGKTFTLDQEGVARHRNKK